MSEPAERFTIYLDPELHRALRLKALDTGRSMTDLVNEAEAIRMAFREDQDEPRRLLTVTQRSIPLFPNQRMTQSTGYCRLAAH